MNTSLGLRLFPSEMVDLREPWAMPICINLFCQAKRPVESSWRSGATEKTMQHRDQMLPGVKAFVVPIRLVFGNNFATRLRSIKERS
ncbi:hypothetical protein V8V91_14880 [Algoriphagus halophilus]